MRAFGNYRLSYQVVSREWSDSYTYCRPRQNGIKIQYDQKKYRQFKNKHIKRMLRWKFDALISCLILKTVL